MSFLLVGKILMDELGITDALDSFTTGNLGACAATALTAIGSLVGGIADKLITKYAFRFKGLVKLVDRIKDLGSKLISAVRSWMRESKAAKALAKAVDAGGDCATKNGFMPATLVAMADGRSNLVGRIG